MIGSTDNMFIRYTFDITKHLTPATNTLKVRFRNIIKHVEDEQSKYPYDVPDDYTSASSGEKYRNYVRKKQCSFSWDWGPCFLPCGIWKPVELVSFDGAYITDMVIRVFREGQYWKIEVQVEVAGISDLVGMTAMLSLLDKFSRGTFEKGSKTVRASLIINNAVDLWWPNGMGKQNLYVLNIHLVDGSGTIHDVKSRRIGFREVQLVQTPDTDGKGSAFYFAVNQKPFFAKGTNFIPIDSFESTVTEDRLRGILESCVDANMNMIRIWGGGVYQHDFFYDICDEIGLLVWQEFMFACAMYPVNKKFLESVKIETEQQVKRLMHHPSICLWSGNNENEEALVTGWHEQVRSNPFLFTVDYHRLYHETIMPIVLDLDTTRSLISSSPFNGTISLDPFTERFKVENPRNYGDTHYYNYKEDGTVAQYNPVCRFASEYGFQGMPSANTMKTFMSAEHQHPLSPFLVRRNHHRHGQPEILKQIECHFKLPFVLSKDASVPLNDADFNNFCMLSQATQALVVKSQTEHYRRLMGENMFCMGALYWQCNDIWEAPTWAGLEYNGKWKLLHNSIKDVFEPVIVSCVSDNKGGFEVWVTNDCDQTLQGSLVIIEHRKFGCDRGVGSLKVLVSNVAVISSKLVTHITDVPEGVHVSTIKLLDSNGKTIAHTEYLYNKYIDLPSSPTAQIDVSYKAVDEMTCKILVRSNMVTPLVILDTLISGRFHPNGFTVSPNEEVEVEFKSTTGKLLVESIESLTKLTCLRHMYDE